MANTIVVRCSYKVMTLPSKKLMAGVNGFTGQTSFNIYMPETKEVSWLVFMISSCYNSCFAKIQKFIKWMAATGINSISLKKGMTASACSKKHNN